MERPKRARVDLTVAQKQEICRYYEKNPSKTIKYLQDHFSSLFGLSIGHSTIGTILKRAEHWNSIEFPDNVRRTQSTKFSNMEKDLFDWICKSPEPVLEGQISQKATELFQDNRILSKEWSAQRGWLTSFKRRFNLVLVPLENQPDGNSELKGYRPGKMPTKRDPVHRVLMGKGRKPSRVNLIRPPETSGAADTSSIIYDAAIENILQDAVDATDIDADAEDGSEVHQASTSAHSSSVGSIPASINMVRLNTSSPARDQRMNTRSASSRLSKVGSVINTRSIIHEAAIENILRNDNENASQDHQSGNSNPASSSSADVFPVVLHAAQSTVLAPSVAVSDAQKAMTTLMTFFEQNSATSQEDLNHLEVIDAKLKWLSAKEAVSNLRMYMLSEPSRNQKDLQYLDGLDQRL